MKEAAGSTSGVASSGQTLGQTLPCFHIVHIYKYPVAHQRLGSLRSTSSFTCIKQPVSKQRRSSAADFVNKHGSAARWKYGLAVWRAFFFAVFGGLRVSL